MTQCDRIKEELRAAGPMGVCSLQFIQSYMPRAAARIDDLEHKGFVISSEPCRDPGHSKYARYRIIFDPEMQPKQLDLALR